MPTYHLNLRGENFERPDFAGKTPPDDSAVRDEAALPLNPMEG